MLNMTIMARNTVIDQDGTIWVSLDDPMFKLVE